jgi:DNA repair exonuclease SbcCD ATPase subunit
MLDIKRISIDGLGPLRGVEINLDALGPGEIAIVGRNGTGKSHALDMLLPGIVGLCLPSHKDESVFDHMTEKASIEWLADLDGKDIRIRIQRSGKSRKAELFYAGESYGPLLTEYRKGVAKYLPSYESILAIHSAAQGDSGDMFRLKPEERRRIFAEMLGIDRYKAWALVAGQIRDSARKELSPISDAIAALEAKLERRRELEAELDRLVSQVEIQQGHVAEFEVELTAAQKKREKLQEEMGIFQALRDERVKARNTVMGEIAEATRKKQELERQIAGMTEYEKVDLSAIESELQGTTEQIATLRAKLTEHQEALDQATLEAGRLSESLRQAQNQQLLRADSIQSIQKRIGKLAPIASGIETVDLSLDICQRCALTAAGRGAIDEIEASRAELASLQAMLVDQARLIDELTPKASAAANAQGSIALGAADTSLAMKAAEQKQQKLMANLRTETARMTEAERLRGENQGRLQELAWVSKRIEDLGVSLTSVEGALSELGEGPDLRAIVGEVIGIESCLKKEREALSVSTEAVARLRGQLDELVRIDSELRQAQAAHAAKLESIDDLGVLQAAIEMVRSAELAMASPHVSRIATELLSGYDGGRFKIDLPPWVEKKDGSGQKEDFTPIITDTFADAARSSVSGGEMALCGEAFRAALAQYNSEKDGVHLAQGFRDETAGRLDPDTATYYVAMLRRAREMARLKQIIFVAHAEAVWKGATKRIFLENGRVREIE